MIEKGLIWRRCGAVAACAAAGLLAVLAFVRPPMMELATNADALLPADLVWQILHRPEAWQSFQWPRIPSLVPDLLVAGPLQAAFGWRWAQLGTSAAFMMALAALAGRIARQAVPSFGAAPFVALTALVLLAEWAVADTPWHLHLLMAAYHSGPFILAVAGLVLAQAMIAGQADILRSALLLATAASGTFSDRLFVGTFLLPVLAGLALEWRAGRLARGRALRLAGLALGGCALGMLADRLVFPALLSRQADVPLAPGLMLRHALAFAGTASALTVAALNLLVLGPLLRGRIPPGMRFWWMVAAAAVVPGSLLAAGLWEDETSQRYLSAALWWPPILWAPILARALGRARPLVLAVCVAAALVAFAARMPPRHPLLAWQDPMAECLAPIGRNTGLADYWTARRMTAASDWTVWALPVNPDGGTRIWGSNPAWYTVDWRTRQGLPDLSFVVLRGLDAAAIRAAYGRPDRVLACPGSEVWLYDDAARLRAGLEAASPGLVARGQSVRVGPDRLRRRGGALGAGPATFEASRQTSRPATWGPNLNLPAGRWRVTLRYRLTTDRPGADRFRVNGQFGTLHLAEAPLPDTHGAIGTVSAEVTLGRTIEAVEVPTYLAGHAVLEILDIDFVPVDGATG